MSGARIALVALALGVATSGYAQSLKFTPPRLLKAELPPLPAPTVVGGGEVLIEATVDRTGALIRPIIVRGTPPYTQLVMDAIGSWRFQPARATAIGGTEDPVDMPVSIGAVYRPPVLMNAPTIGEPPKDWSKPSAEVSYPLSTAMPNYPPLARDGGVVLLEVTVDEAGAITETRGLGSNGGFESASRQALSMWKFRGGSYRARPVTTTAYVLFGFRPPIVSAPVPTPR